MNQDQIKQLLLQVRACATDFTVTMTGKKSGMVNGLYKPQTREILIHNKNFQNDGQMVYTALHEYAHHLISEKNGFIPGGRVHTNEFWSVFHSLLEDAEDKKLYSNSFDTEPAFLDLTARIKALLPENGRVMLEFGKLIVEAEALCRTHFVRFEDYLDRALGVPRTSAGAALKAFTLQVPPDLGWDAMKVVAGLRQPQSRATAIDAFRAGKSPDAVKSLVRQDKPPEDTRERLDRERARLERTISHLQERLSAVQSELERME